MCKAEKWPKADKQKMFTLVVEENIFELSVLGHFSVLRHKISNCIFLFLFLVKLLHISSSQSNRKDVIIYQVYIYEYYITVSI